MRFRRFRATNFIVFPEVELNFDTGLTLVDGWNFDTGQANGAGKSVLFNAVAYSVYGKVVVDDVNLSDLIPEWGGPVTTEVELDTAGGAIKIIRSRNPTGLQLFVDNAPFKGTGPELEKRIISLVGLTFEQFLKVSYFYQGARDRFADVNDTEKKSFLASILGLDRCEAAYKVALNRSSEAEKNIASKEGSLEEMKRSLAAKKAMLIQAQGRYADREAAMERDIARLKEEHKPDNYFVKLALRSEELKKSITDTQAALNALPALSDDTDLRKKQSLAAGAAEMLGKLRAQIEGAGKDIARFQRQLEEPPASCKACGQDLPESRVDAFRVAVREQLLLRQNELQTFAEKAAKAERLLTATAEATKALNERTKVERVTDQTRTGLLRLKDELERVEAARAREKEMLEVRAKAFSDAVAALHAQLLQLKHAVEECADWVSAQEHVNEQVAKEVAAMQENVAYLQETKRVFGPTGLRAHVVDGVVTELNERIAHYIDLMFGGMVLFRYDLDDSGKLVSRLTYGGRDRSSWATLSGGQRQRVRLAVDFALADVVSNRLSVKPNVLFLDEVAPFMDSTGRDAMLAMLQELERDRDAIYVSDHESEFKSRFSRSIRLELKGGQSRIVEV